MLILSTVLLSFQSSIEVLITPNNIDSLGSKKFVSSSLGVRAHVKDNWALNEYMQLTLGGYTILGDDIIEDKVFLSHASTSFDSVFGNSQLALGRMPLDLDNGLLVSMNCWQIEPYFHDGVLLKTPSDKLSLQAFYFNAATGLSGAREDVISGFLLESPDQDFSTTYLRREQYEQAIDEYNFAFRLFKNFDSGLFWDSTIVFQQGDDDVRDVSSIAFVSSLTKELDFGHKVGLSFSLAQGDRQDPTNRSSYSPGLIDRHQFAGKADVLSFSNLVDIAFEYELLWDEHSSFHVDLHSFSRQTTSDGIYLFDESSVTSTSSSSEIARELDMYISAIFLDRIVLQGGLSVFQWQDKTVSFSDEVEYAIYLHADYSF